MPLPCAAPCFPLPTLSIFLLCPLDCHVNHYFKLGTSLEWQKAVYRYKKSSNNFMFAYLNVHISWICLMKFLQQPCKEVLFAPYGRWMLRGCGLPLCSLYSVHKMRHCDVLSEGNRIGNGSSNACFFLG